ncbi:bacterio-opsin activator domain-containing protein [Halomarina halobia]|uniref:Bacterio-opsin activator domain-containing protein n=1 Tax=Halomarina halobia TaxID=3033386 RepID=A0ABD6AA19_9EURY|nr:bacterio-opsin activator domain-containing protein [Halomarina sp. PSR21]
MLAGERDAEGDDVLDAASYEQLRRAAETHREDVVVRLGGEVGLHPEEMTRVRLVDVLPHGEHFFLRVPGGESDAREAYLPSDVEHDLRKYADGAGIAPDEPLVGVSPRRVQMLVAEVAARAAETTGEAVFDGLSTRDLRRYFARRLLVERGLDPRVVLAVGAYDRPERLAPYLEPAGREAVVAAFERRGAGDVGRPNREGTERLRTVATLLRDASAALTDVTTEDAVETVACERLMGTTAYRTATVFDPAAGTEPPEDGPAAQDALADALADDESTRTAVRAAVDEERVSATTVEVSTGRATVIVVPLVHGRQTYGALCAVPTAPVADAERDLLAIYGAHVAAALAGVEHKRLLLADTATELTLQSTACSFLATASSELDCTFRLEGLAPAEAGSFLCYVTVDGASPDAALERAADARAIEDARLVSGRPEGALLELVVTDSPVRALVECGGTVRDLVVERGTATLVGEVASDVDVREVVEAVRSAYPRTRLIAKREVERPVRSDGSFPERLDDILTDRQLSVLRAAYYAGYFEWPRESTAEELADSVGISSPTLHNHLRRAQQKLLTTVLDQDRR